MLPNAGESAESGRYRGNAGRRCPPSVRDSSALDGLDVRATGQDGLCASIPRLSTSVPVSPSLARRSGLGRIREGDSRKLVFRVDVSTRISSEGSSTTRPATVASPSSGLKGEAATQPGCLWSGRFVSRVYLFQSTPDIDRLFRIFCRCCEMERLSCRRLVRS